MFGYIAPKPDPFHQIVYEKEPRKPMWWLWYVSGAVLMVAAVILPCIGTGVLFSKVAAVAQTAEAAEGQVFTPPGEITVQIATPGKQIIWIDELDDPDESDFAAPSVPTGFSAQVTGPGNATIPTTPIPASREVVYSGADSERIGAFEFNAATPGAYTIAVSKPIPPPLRVAVSHDMNSEIEEQVGKLGMGMLAIIGFAILLFVAGLALLIITGIRHSNYRPQ